ncbi:MAG: tetratricopeptide repeat protein, partial [Candidatus Krumholzibacteriota bacterium]|nr:tetratricopeptide repeat protein [Candidatus Krumholzibacteriota bacterium]
ETFAGVAEPAHTVLVETEDLLRRKDTRTEEWAPAAARLDSVLAAHSGADHAKLRQRLGLFLFNAGRHAEAVDHLERAVALDPEFGRAWTALAQASREAGLVERSQAAAERGVALLDPVSRSWERYWYVYVFIQVGMSLFVIAWFTTGGLRDVRRMLSRLAVMDRDAADDGMVSDAPRDDDGPPGAPPDTEEV